MKNSIFIIFLFFGVNVISSVHAEPAFEISETAFNFGKVSQSVNVSHTFWIKSTGDDTLIISKVNPGCGCTRAPIQDTILAPGDSTSLKIYFDTKRYKGHVIKQPSFFTNASDKAFFIKILSEPLPDPTIVQPILIDPIKIDVSQFTETVRRISEFNIINKGAVDYEVHLIDKPENDFDIKLPQIIKAGDTAIAKIIVRDESIEKHFQHSFTVEFNDDNRTRYTIPVRRLYRNVPKR